jgi:hypothetical protein
MKHFTLILTVIMGLLACKSQQPSASGHANLQSNKRPTWVDQRPVNNFNYVGVGRASKITNPVDYLQVAKKEALQDLAGEIKVTVSTNSLLSQYQNNTQFNQQFFSDTRLKSNEFLEGFTVVDSWENKNEYWIYYTLNKEEYEARKRRKIQLAANQALELMQSADALSVQEDFVSIFKLRVKALAILQDYFNEAVEANYKGKDVYLVNEIFTQLQSQLFTIRLEANPKNIDASAGKPFSQTIGAKAFYRNKDSLNIPLLHLPLIASDDAKRLQGNPKSETNEAGVAVFGLTRTLSREPHQQVKIRPDLEKLIRSDSLNNSLRTLLLNLETPSANMLIKVEPLRIYFESKELNLGQPLTYNIIEPALKKKLAENGCIFTTNLQQADYAVSVVASTRDLGVIWGNMLQSLLDLEVIIKNPKTGDELLHENLSGVQGFQTSKEKAGEDAYKKAISPLLQKVFPEMEKALFYQ